MHNVCNHKSSGGGPTPDKLEVEAADGLFYGFRLLLPSKYNPSQHINRSQDVARKKIIVLYPYPQPLSRKLGLV